MAYQEHWLDTLDQAIAQQERRLMKLERLGELMQTRLKDMQASTGQGMTPGPDDELPPHY
ncbi:SlyX family protein [Halomonas sp. V046]|uniref:SlyX family protein n=1 Tax=Halomonas sp. V046 TaxID=3459611 RepID=UPI004043A7F4